jgi:hypothetical protein
MYKQKNKDKGKGIKPVLTRELPEVLAWVDLGVHIVDDAGCCKDTLWGCANRLCERESPDYRVGATGRI